MKKAAGFILLSVLALTAVPALAEREPSEGTEMKRGMGDKPGMRAPEGPGMMMGMMQKSMAASSDGGVIVLSGSKLMKYDADLNLVKEVEIPMDMESMKKSMADMKKCMKMMGDAKDKKPEPRPEDEEGAEDGAEEHEGRD